MSNKRIGRISIPLTAATKKRIAALNGAVAALKRLEGDKRPRIDMLRDVAEKWGCSGDSVTCSAAGVLLAQAIDLVPRWIPVDEQRPAVGEKVAVFDPHWPIWQSGRLQEDGTWNCEGMSVLEPTHWMPLPEGPQ